MCLHTRLGALVVVTGLLVAACSATSEDETATDGDSAAVDGATDSATSDADETDDDVAADAPGDDDLSSIEGPTTGITDDAIRIGAMIADFGSLAGTGLVIDIGDEAQQYQALVDEVNAAGGVSGRDLELTTYTYSVTDDATQQAACIAATEDDEVLIVLASGGFQAEATSCVARQHETLILSNSSFARSFLDTSEGRMLTIGPNQTRAARAWAQLLSDAGELEGETIGIVHMDNPTMNEFVPEGLVSTLTDLGHDGVEVISLPCPTLVCEQHATAVERLRSAGVTAVFAALGPVALPTFVGAADAAGFDPTFFVQEQNTTATVTQLLEGVKAPIDGALGVTHFALASENLAHVPFAECNDRFTAITGVAYEAETTLSPDVDKYAAVGSTCVTFDYLIEALNATGGNLNQTSLSLALQRGGELSFVYPAEFAEGKLDAADGFRVQQLDSACFDDETVPCWTPLDAEFTIVE